MFGLNQISSRERFWCFFYLSMGNGQINQFLFFFYYSESLRLNQENMYSLLIKPFENLEIIKFSQCGFADLNIENICEEKWKNLKEFIVCKIILIKTHVQFQPNNSVCLQKQNGKIFKDSNCNNVKFKMKMINLSKL